MSGSSIRRARRKKCPACRKVHALVGGFHLGPAPADYMKQVIGEIRALNPT